MRSILLIFTLLVSQWIGASFAMSADSTEEQRQILRKEACLDRVRDYLLEEQYDKVVQEVSQLLPDLKPEQDDAILASALCLRAQAYFYLPDKEREAIADADKSLAIEPCADAYYARGGAYFYLDDYDKAIADCTRAIVMKKNFSEALAMRAAAHIEHRDGKASLSDLTKAIALSPDSGFAYKYRAMLHLDSGRAKLAVKDVTKFIELEPDSPTGYAVRSLALQGLSQPDKALEDARKAVEVKPDSGRAGFAFLYALLTSKKFTEAIAESTRQIEKNVSTTDSPYWMRASALVGLGEYEKALPDAEKAVQLDYNSAYAHATLSVVYLYLKRYSESVKEASLALSFEPKNIYAHSSRGYVNILRAEPLKAMGDLNKAVKLSPTWPESYSDRCLAHLELNDVAAAKKDLKRALKLRGKYSAQDYLALSVLSKMAEDDAAAQKFISEMQADPEYPKFKDILAEAAKAIEQSQRSLSDAH